MSTVPPIPPAPGMPVQKRNTTIIWIVVAICVVGFCGLLAVVAAVLFPVFAQAREAAVATMCLSNIKQIATAQLVYSVDNDDRFPAAEDWQDRVTPYTTSQSLFDCPKLAKDGQSNGYAMNAKLGGVAAIKVAAPAETVLLFESMRLERNAHSGLEALPNPGRHLRKNSVAFADGSSRKLAPEETSP